LVRELRTCSFYSVVKITVKSHAICELGEVKDDDDDFGHDEEEEIEECYCSIRQLLFK
jgi:hypothetical protein